MAIVILGQKASADAVELRGYQKAIHERAPELNANERAEVEDLMRQETGGYLDHADHDSPYCVWKVARRNMMEMRRCGVIICLRVDY